VVQAVRAHERQPPQSWLWTSVVPEPERSVRYVQITPYPDWKDHPNFTVDALSYTLESNWREDILPELYKRITWEAEQITLIPPPSFTHDTVPPDDFCPPLLDHLVITGSSVSLLIKAEDTSAALYGDAQDVAIKGEDTDTSIVGDDDDVTISERKSNCPPILDE